MSLTDAWVVWSYEHDAWWGPSHWGYVEDLLAAGVYTEEQAKAIEQLANQYRSPADPNERAYPLLTAFATLVVNHQRRDPESTVLGVLAAALPGMVDDSRSIDLLQRLLLRADGSKGVVSLGWDEDTETNEVGDVVEVYAGAAGDFESCIGEGDTVRGALKDALIVPSAPRGDELTEPPDPAAASADATGSPLENI